jgi:uncharacterized protein YecE (DUF72 family)
MWAATRRRPRIGGAVWVGTSGWVYKHWQGRFYPPEVRAEARLPFYAARFPTVEVNYSFYRLPTREIFETWGNGTPDGFVFAVKASRYLTHMKRLRDAAEPLERLMASVSGLGPKLGPILFQFPHTWQIDLERLAAFLRLHPPSARFAFEFRHSSWLRPEVYECLREHHCALCIPDSPTLPQDRQVTTDFTYVRLHAGRSDGGNYTEGELASWADWLRGRRDEGVHAWVYFNNDWEGFAPQNAQRLMELLG